jgi:hypothetical protein
MTTARLWTSNCAHDASLFMRRKDVVCKHKSPLIIYRTPNVDRGNASSSGPVPAARMISCAGNHGAVHRVLMAPCSISLISSSYDAAYLRMIARLPSAVLTVIKLPT